MTPLPLDVLLGPHGAARFLSARTDDLVHQDHLDPTCALRLVCERATDGDPMVIASPGQTWSLQADVDPDDAPAQRLAVHARLNCPPRILASDLDDPNGTIGELPIEALDLYTLTTWTPDAAGLEVS